MTAITGHVADRGGDVTGRRGNRTTAEMEWARPGRPRPGSPL